MALIKEPLNVDFYVTGQEKTDEDQKRVSEYIKQQKAKKKITQVQKQGASEPTTAT